MTETTRKIEIFRPGTFTSRAGVELTFTEQDLRAVAAAYDPAVHEAPLVVGHPSHDAPAYGWITGLEFADGRLVATVGRLAPELATAVAEGRFRKVSPAFYPPTSKSNPKPGTLSLRHVGVLGAAPPACSGLKPLAFSDDVSEAVVMEFSGRTSAGLWSSLRDFLIEKFGRDEAERAVPGYQVQWLAEESVREDMETAPAFSQPEAKSDPMPDTPDLDARARELDAREHALQAKEMEFSAQETARRHADDAAFVDGLIREGRVASGDRAQVLEFLAALDATSALEFSEGDGKVTKTPWQAFRDRLAAQPKLVTTGEIAGGKPIPEGQEVAFSAPPGLTVDAAGLDLHRRATEYQRLHPNTSTSPINRPITLDLSKAFLSTTAASSASSSFNYLRQNDSIG
ncbi:MAG: hypothetical protein HQL34_07535, partial [Alphaproteobacteria bacterium]|nr:hypothetical protein [Alphaproteobacteria bacterium]